MSEPTSAGEPRPSDTTARLKHEIDSGRTGDKVGGFDPAAAPLGTDAEAGGDRPTAAQLAEDRSFQRAAAGRASGRANAATPELAPNARMGPQRGLMLAGAAGVGAGLLLAGLLLAAL